MNTLKQHILGSELRPTRLRVWLKFARYFHWFVRDYGRDAKRYIQHSSTFDYKLKRNLQQRVVAMYHNVEKGLALPAPRPGFGADNIRYLLSAIEEYITRFGIDKSLQAPAAALNAYATFNEANGIADFPHRTAMMRLGEKLGSIVDESSGGTVFVKSSEIYHSVQNVDDAFFFNRYSIRQFSDKDINSADIDAAVAIAQKAPAVCNRQDSFVRIYHDPSLIQLTLDLHGGARGFSEQVKKLLLITTRVTSFWGSGERNQCWIDGGLFAMSLIFGLHSRGLGTCCLNWSKTVPDDDRMRALLHIPDDEVIIMFLAVGHLPEALTVARSVRRPLEDAREHIF